MHRVVYELQLPDYILKCYGNVSLCHNELQKNKRLASAVGILVAKYAVFVFYYTEIIFFPQTTGVIFNAIVVDETQNFIQLNSNTVNSI